MRNKGQAMLIGILVIFTASISLAVAGALMATTQITAVQNQKLSIQAFSMASGCLDNVLMQMDRGEFNAPQNLSEGNNKCIISITGSIAQDVSSYQIVSKAEFPLPLLNLNVTKTIQASVSVSNGVINVISRQEVY